uniref:Nucleosome assembly protein, putative n=1 Tax=Arundo donax TaxID=35708 RepID=A0A0A8ZU51_ARUDO
MSLRNFRASSSLFWISSASISLFFIVLSQKSGMPFSFCSAGISSPPCVMPSTSTTPVTISQRFE